MKHVHPKHVVNQPSASALKLSVKLVSNATWLSVSLTLLIGFIIAACQDHVAPPLPGQSIQSNSPKPDWGPTITPQSLAIIEELGRLNPIPLNLLSPQEARMKPSVKDAVTSLLDKNHLTPPPANVTQTKRFIPGAGGTPIEIAVFTPKNVSGTLPVIVYYHGGGWVIANSDVYEASTLALAQNTSAVVFV